MISRDGFRVGQGYTRKEISVRLGGSVQNYLPHKDCHVVCGCFRKDLNPNAPTEVLPANTDDKRRWAQVFSEQQEGVPIFVKQASNRWVYQGVWRCASVITDRDIVRQKSKQAGRSEVAMVLKLERVLS